MASRRIEDGQCVVCHSESLSRRGSLASYELIVCRDCGVLFKSSLWSTDTAQLEAVYQSPAYWESYANRQDGGVDYDANHPRVRLYRRDLATLEDLLGGPGRLLDVGCARGVFLDVARRAGWSVAGVELASHAARYAREQFGLEIFEGRLEDADWPNAAFDAITLFDVIEHLADPGPVLHKASTLLRPGGCLLVTTPNAGSLLHRLSMGLYKASLGVIRKPTAMVYGLGGKGHVLFLNRVALSRLLAGHGLETVRASQDAVDQGLWAPLTSLWIHRALAVFDRCVAGPVNAKYRLVLYAKKPGAENGHMAPARESP